MVYSTAWAYYSHMIHVIELNFVFSLQNIRITNVQTLEAVYRMQPGKLPPFCQFLAASQYRKRIIGYFMALVLFCSFCFSWLLSKFHYTDPRTSSATQPDQTHGQSPYMSRLSGRVWNPSGPWVWSGRVRVVEFGHIRAEHGAGSIMCLQC